MQEYVEIGGIKIDKELFALVNNEIAPGTAINAIQILERI